MDVAAIMAPPWTAEEAASEAVSKKMLIAYLQENGDTAFLNAERLSGTPAAVQKRLTKTEMVESYKKLIGGAPSTKSDAADGSSPAGGFTFSASPFGTPSPNLMGNIPAPPASSFQFNFSAPAKQSGGSTGKKGGKKEEEEDDEEFEVVDTEKMTKTKGKGSGKLRASDGDEDDEDEDSRAMALRDRLERLNMSASQRRDATLAELEPVRSQP